MSKLRARITVGVLVFLGAAVVRAQVDFDRDVRPILAGHCYECHGPDQAKGGLRLTDRAAAFKKTKSEKPAIVAGKPEQSEIIRRVTTSDEDDHMPPAEKEPLKPAQVEVLRKWIAEGAPYADHWAFQKIARPVPPAVKNRGWVMNGIDPFVLARLEEKGIAPSPAASRYTLIKRLYDDLIGLPPAVAEVDVFVADQSANAYEALVDRLLANPHFGERWGRHWLDKARYADSDGYEKDSPRLDAWRYRDWVIEAVNRDLPFDQFTIQQLAGDLVENPGNDTKIATAFHRQTLTNKEGGVDQEQFRVEATFDRVETTGSVWLGLTVGCARCHGHKYDPISQKEYYQLFAFFNNADEVEVPVPLPADVAAAFKKETEVHAAKVKALETKLAEAKTAKSGSATDLQKQLDALKRTAPKDPGSRVRVMGARKSPRENAVLSRGDFLRPEAPVGPGTLAALHPFKPRNPQQPDRLDLAMWLVDRANPLTARVVVNQVWSHLFGKGLVRTMTDFGVRGEKPTHPELLDYLATRFMEDGWSRKRLIKSIVMSAAYRQSSVHRPELAEMDPDNRLLARQNRYRVEGEIVRDLTLAVAGQLSGKIGGPSVFPPMPADVAALSYANNFKYIVSEGEDRYRRGMYTFFKRTAPHPNLTTFDCPDSNATAIERSVSNTPLQALTMLNNESFHEAAVGLAGRMMALGGDDGERLAAAFRMCVMRPPTQPERSEFMSLLERCREYYKANPAAAKQLVGGKCVKPEEKAAWVATGRILLNLDEFVTRE